MLCDDVEHWRVAIIAPYLILIPLLSWVANDHSIDTLFMICSGILLFIVTPIYLALVVHSEKRGF